MSRWDSGLRAFCRFRADRARLWSVAVRHPRWPARIAVAGWRMYASRYREDEPIFNPAGLRTNAIIGSIHTDRLKDGG